MKQVIYLKEENNSVQEVNDKLIADFLIEGDEKTIRGVRLFLKNSPENFKELVNELKEIFDFEYRKIKKYLLVIDRQNSIIAKELVENKNRLEFNFENKDDLNFAFNSLKGIFKLNGGKLEFGNFDVQVLVSFVKELLKTNNIKFSFKNKSYPFGKYISTREIEKKYGVSRQTLFYWRKKNLIRYKKYSDKKIVYLENDVIKLVKEIPENDSNKPIQNIKTDTKKEEIKPSKKSENSILKKLEERLVIHKYRVPEKDLKKLKHYLNFSFYFGNEYSPQVLINDEGLLVDKIFSKNVTQSPEETLYILEKLDNSGKKIPIDFANSGLSGFERFLLNNVGNEEGKED